MSGVEHPDWPRLGADWPNRTASQFLQAGDVRWHLQRMGRGPIVLLLHGAGGATHSWRDLLPLLAERFDVIAPDLPGHGFSRPASPRQLSLPGMTAAVSALMGALDSAPSMIVGHSAGAAIAINSALDGLLSPRRIVGLNPALKPFGGVAGVVFPPLAKVLALNPVTPWIFSSVASTGRSAQRLIEGTGSRIDARGMEIYERLLGRPSHVGNALSMMALWDLNPLLARIGTLTTSTHLIVGTGDRTISPREALDLAAQYDVITVEEIDGLGHLMHEEAPDLIARRIAAMAPI